jgi:two-component system, OmpR family, alkaline phosphatase synthesis response regulator PhoP
VAARAQETNQPERSAETAVMNNTILVVDDQPHIVRLIQVNLEKEGYRVVTAGDGVEGMEKVRQELPALVILDVIMPRKDGFEVLREIKEDAALAHIPVVMLTVKAHNADIVEGLKEGAELYLPKPFHPKELVTLVKRVLEGSHGEEAQ